MYKYRSSTLTLMFLWFVGSGAVAADHAPAIPASAATHAFSEAHKLCMADNGELWDHSLCGPMVFVDQASGTAVLNAPVPGAIRDGALWRTTLPESVPLGYTAIEYSGQRWTMLLWPLPEDKTERDILLMHESFHRVQPALGLPAGSGMVANGHLDTRKGRIWLRAEMHSLLAALCSTGDDRKRALTDALLVRVYRRSLWPQAAEQELELELNEGLAASTGIDAALPDRSARIEAASEAIKTIENVPSYVRSFAYATGPAYAELLNAADPGWRRRVTPAFDFGIATSKAYRIALPSADKAAAVQALYRHDGRKITAQEDRRAEKTKARNTRYKEAFITGRTVTFPLIKSSTSFDPRQITQFADHGSVYNVIHINDVWGELSVKTGALVSSGFDHIILPIKQELTGDHLSGDGWSATLKGTFGLAPDPHKPGSWVVVKKETPIQ